MISNGIIIQRLELHEGYRSQKYVCTGGKVTQGIGHNLQDNPLSEVEISFIKDIDNWTRREAQFVLSNDIEKGKKELSKSFSWFEELDDERQYALIDMNFQLGHKGLLKFKKMIKALESKDYKEASKQCLDSAYAKQTPKRAKRISYLIENGIWKL